MHGTSDPLPETRGSLQLYFSTQALVKSLLIEPGGREWMTGVKDHEVRWQQGTMAICILLLHTKIAQLLELPEEAYFLSGDRGSPARSLDNLLNKPGEWALQMFGEKNGFASIRQYLYRKKTVTRNNQVSELRWDDQALPPSNIDIFIHNRPCTDWRELTIVLKNICLEFSPESGAAYAEELTLVYEASRPAKVESPPLADLPPAANPHPNTDATVPSPRTGPPNDSVVTPAASTSARDTSMEDGKSRQSWMIWLIGLCTLPLLWWAHASLQPPPAAMEDLALAAVEEFFEHINARDYDQAYRLTSDRLQRDLPWELFLQKFHRRTFEDLRLLGQADNLQPGKTRRGYQLSTTVLTEARMIPELAGIGQLKVGQMDVYLSRLQVFRTNLERIGVASAEIDQLEKQQLERLDLSRYLVEKLGIEEETLARIYPATIKVETTLRQQLFLRLDETTGNWQMDRIEEYPQILGIP